MDKTAADADPRIRTLMEETAAMMAELSRLSQRLSELGQTAGAGFTGVPGAGDGDPVADIQAQLRQLQDRLAGFVGSSRAAFDQLHANVQRSPYLFILGALGLGFLLGKSKRL